MILKKLSTFIKANWKTRISHGIHVLLLCLSLLTAGCSTHKERTAAALQQGNFSVLFPPVLFDELPHHLFPKTDIWLSDSQAKRKIQFGTIESRYETFKALFLVYFPTRYLTDAKSQVRSLSLLILEKMWREVREDKEWSSFLTLLSNLKLFQAKMARSLVFEYLRRDKTFDETADSKIWDDLERRMTPFLRGIDKRKTLPALFNMYPAARRQFLDALQTAHISFFSQMSLKARAKINRAIYEEHFGTLLSNRSAALEQDFFLEETFEETNQDFEHREESSEKSNSVAVIDRTSQRSSKLNSKCHLVYNAKTNTLDGQIDVAVVGAGSTGSYMAFLLWRAGYKVLLIDKGPLPTRFSPMGNRYALWNMDFVNGKNFFQEGKLLVIKPELIGGGDTLGPQLAWPVSDTEMTHFIQSKREAGSFPLAFYDEDKLSDLQTSVTSASGIRVRPDEEVDSREKLFSGTALFYGLDVRALRSAFGDGGLTKSAYIKTNMPFDSYLQKALSDYKNPLCLLPRILVKKVIVQKIGSKLVTKGPVMQVLPWPRDTRYEIYPPLRLQLPDNLVFKVLPKLVILSAGVPGTLQIMHNSGITHPELGKSIAFNYAQLLLGFYLQDLQTMAVPFTRIALGPKRSNEMDPFDYLIHEVPFEGPHLAQLAGPYTEWAYPLFRHADQVRTLLVSVMNEPVGGNEYRAGDGGFKYNNLDLSFDKLKSGLLMAAKMHFNLGARTVMLPQLSRDNDKGSGSGADSGSGNDFAHPFHFTSLEEFEAYLRELKQVPYVTPMFIFAPNGGAVRGQDEQIAPLDLLGRPQGFENLYVMDATVVPPGIGPYHSFFLKTMAHTLIQAITGQQ